MQNCACASPSRNGKEGNVGREKTSLHARPLYKLDEEQAVVVGEPYTTTAAALQDNQLISKHCVLGFNPHPRLEWRCQDGQNEVEQPDHPASLNGHFSRVTPG